MSQESDDKQDMRPEYDIRGGTRGKYLGQYRHQGPSVTFEDSPLIATSTAGGAEETPGSVIWLVAYPPPYPSPTIQLGTPEPAASGR
jgi:hypothetical protein